MKVFLEDLLLKRVSSSTRQIISSWEIEQDLKKQLGESQWDKRGGYEALAQAVEGLVEKGTLSPVKASGHNGRIPPLFARYRRISKKIKQPPELFHFQSRLDLSFYANNPREFKRYEPVLRSLDQYLIKTAQGEPAIWDTLNERSFQLAGDEKFLASTEGAALLRRVKICLEELYCFPVPEPFFYRQARNRPFSGNNIINALILENKDTFDTVCRLQEKGLVRFLPPLDLFIYGEGNKITGSWPFLFKTKKAATAPINLFYFGDLDPEGIAIFNRLRRSVKEAFARTPTHFAPGREPQVLLAEKLYRLLLDQGKSRSLPREFSSAGAGLEPGETWCNPELAAAITSLWLSGEMIPQEALSASFLANLQEVKIV